MCTSKRSQSVISCGVRDVPEIIRRVMNRHSSIQHREVLVGWSVSETLSHNQPNRGFICPLFTTTRNALERTRQAQDFQVGRVTEQTLPTCAHNSRILPTLCTLRIGSDEHDCSRQNDRSPSSCRSLVFSIPFFNSCNNSRCTNITP